jgi:hypothetical protein
LTKLFSYYIIKEINILLAVIKRSKSLEVFKREGLGESPYMEGFEGSF